MARIYEQATTEREYSPVLRNMTIGQATYIFTRAGIAVEVNEGHRVKFVEGKEKKLYGV